MSVVPGPPRWLVAAAGVALALGVAIAVVGGWRTGVSWDEPYHVMRMRNYLDSGWYLLDQDLDTRGRPGPWLEQRHVYAPVTMLLLHGWAMLLGVEAGGTIADTELAFAVRHLGVTLISLVGVAATAVLARLLLRTWGWSVVAAAVLVAVPTWTGHAMFNVKDVPVATGYTLVTLGLVVLARTRGRRWRASLGAATVLAGLVLAVGTRPGIWPGLALAGAVALVVALRRRDWLRVGVLLALPLAAVAILVLLYPAAFGSPVTALVDGALSSSRYDGRQGQWYYLPVFLVVELPTLLLALGAVGTVVVVRRVRGAVVADDELDLGWVLVLLQAFALPVLAVVREANLYTGVRQLLFATPALALLVTCALAALLARSDRSGRGDRVDRRPLAVVAGVAVGVPLLVQGQLFPYSYAYSSAPANLLAPTVAARDPDLELPTDYWRTSVRELAPGIPADGYVTCTPLVEEGRFLPQASDSRQDCAVEQIGPLAPYADDRVVGAGVAATRFLAVDAGTTYVGANCEVLDRVTRDLWWRTVTMSTLADCDLVLAEPPASGAIAFDGAGTGAQYLRGDWLTNRAVSGATLAGTTGLIGLTLEPGPGPVGLVVRGSGLDTVAARANGTAVPASGTAEALVVEIPSAVAAAYGEGRLVLELTTTAPGSPRLAALEVTDP